jgi:glutamine phosphoribosylpyrophosphate amidotransferase
MCGIAGFSSRPDAAHDALALTRVLLASVADRGEDAAGSAWFRDGEIVVHKQYGGASTLLRELTIPSDQHSAVVHVREFTKGRPSLMANNHPIRHGRIVGVHNGRVENDEQVFATLARDRAEPGMTVDSEAIFASLDATETDQTGALERLRGSLACAWIDADRPDSIFLARGHGRPLWLARAADDDFIIWASTIEAIEIAEEHLGMTLRKRPVRAGSIVEIRAGRIVDVQRFIPDTSASWLMNPIASPHERTRCLRELRPRIA